MNWPGALGVLAALQGGVAVGFGAFGAHVASSAHAKALFETGARYQGPHALAAIAAIILWREGARGGLLSCTLFNAGALLFSTSLYALGLGAPRILGLVTPIGGSAMICGWIALAFGIWGLARKT